MEQHILALEEDLSGVLSAKKEGSKALPLPLYSPIR